MLAVGLVMLAGTGAAWALLGDLDGTGRVDGVDLILLSRALGTIRGEERFIDAADLDGDGRVTDRDLAILRANFARVGRDQNLWLADSGHDRLAKVNVQSGQLLLTVPVTNPQHVAADPSSGDAWVSTTHTGLLQIDSRGRVLSRLTGFGRISGLAVDGRSHTCYVSDESQGKVWRISSGIAPGTNVATPPSSEVSRITSTSGFYTPIALALDATRNALWVLERNRQLVRLSTQAPPGYTLSSSGYHVTNNRVVALGSLDLNRLDGSVFVTDLEVSLRTDYNPLILLHRVFRVPSSNSGEMFSGDRGVGNFVLPGAVSVNPVDSSAWIADTQADGVTLVKLATDGTEVTRVRGFRGPVRLSTDPFTGTLWVADTGADRAYKLSSTGVRVLEVGGLSRPAALEVLSGDTIRGAPVVSGLAVPGSIEVGQAVSFSAASGSAGTTLVRYEWDFDGNGSFDYSNERTASTSYTYTREGVFNAVLRVTDAEGLTGQDYSPMIRVGRLRVTATASPVQGPAPLPVTLTATAVNPQSGRIDSVQWDFDGDGQYDQYTVAGSNVLATRRTYASAGTYNSRVKVTDESGRTAEDSLQVRVFQATPTASASASPQSGATPLKVSFSGSAGVSDAQIALYQWDFDGNGTFDYASTSSATQTFTYTNAGVYMARLLVTDTKGLTATDSRPITVTAGTGSSLSPERPIVSARGEPLRGSAPLAVNFGARAVDLDGRIVRYDWRFGDNPSSSTTLLSDGAEGGLANFTADGTWGTSTTKAHSGTAFHESPAGNYANSLDIYLTSRVLQLNGVARATLSYWQAFDTESCCDYGRVEVAKNGGSFEVLAGTEVRGLQADFAAKQALIEELDGVSTLQFRFKFHSDGSVVRDGWYVDDILLVAETAAVDFTSTTTATTSHTYTAAGNYNASLTVVDDGGNRASSSVAVQVLAATAPLAAGTVQPSAGGAPLAVTLDASTSRGTGALYQWSPYGAAFEDDAEGGSPKWTATGSWQISSERAHSGARAWTESPGGSSSPTAESLLVSQPFDLPVTGPASVSFWYSSDLPYGDGLFLEISADGQTWTQLAQMSSTSSNSWREQQILGRYSYDVLYGFTGRRNLRLRFRYTPNGDTSVGTGFLFDNLLVKGTDAAVFDGGAVSTPTRAFTYFIPGLHDARLRVDAGGLHDFADIPVRVGQPATSNQTPSISLYSSLYSGPAPLEVTFGISSYDQDGSIQLYEFDADGDGTPEFAGGSTSHAYVYSRPGRYVLRGWVVDSGGATNTATRLVEVLPPLPDAGVTFTPRRGRSPLPVTFTVTASAPAGTTVTGVFFDFDNNGVAEWSATQVPVTTTYTFSTNYSYQWFYPRVWVRTGQGGERRFDSIALEVVGPAKLLATASASPAAGPVPLTVQFTGTGSLGTGTNPVTNYSWDFDGDGNTDYTSATTGSTQKIYGRPGSYTARFRIQSASDSDQAEFPIRVGSPPVAEPRGAPLSGPAPLTVTFFSDGADPDGTIAQYDWDFDGDGVRDKSNQVSVNARHTFSQPGTYDARLTVTDDTGLTDTRTLRIAVGGSTATGLAQVMANPASGSAPLPVRLGASLPGTSGSARRFQWDFDGNGTIDLDSQTAAGPAHIYALPGEYTARVSITDDRDQVFTGSVVVKATSPGSPSASGNTYNGTGAAPLLVNFSGYGSTTSGSIERYEWDFDGDGNSDYISATTGNTSYTYTRAGDYVARFTVTNSAGLSDTARVPVRVSIGIAATRSPETFDPDVGETARFVTTLTAPARVTLRVQDRNGVTVKTLVSSADRTAGFYTDTWNGLDNQGAQVPAGVYVLVIDYVAGSSSGTYDPSGEVQENRLEITPDYDSTFNPLLNKFLSVRFTLDRLAEATIYVVDFTGGGARRRVKTILLREPLPKGSYVIPWDGTDDSGLPAPVTNYIMPVFFWELPRTAVVVAGRPILSDPQAAANTISPGVNPYAANGTQQAEVSYTLSKRSRVDATVLNESNTVVKTFRFDNAAAGRNSFTWDCRNLDGSLVDEGSYRIRLVATDSRGNPSPPLFVSLRIVY